MTNENLIIDNLNQFNDLLKEKKEIVLKKEIIDGTEICSIFYNISDKDTFNTLLARECRGITFDLKTGALLARPLHKFFNINEREETQWNLLDWNNITYIGNKFDGSMIYPVFIKGKIYLRTKKGFDTDVAKKANDFFNKRYSYKDTVYEIVKMHETPIFEYIAPNNQIVIKYNEEDLKLLHIRDNKTGKYNYKTESFNIIGNINKPAEEYIGNVYANEKELEGYVIYDGRDFYKQKTKWYLERHKVISALSYKHLIDLILNDTIDDVISFLQDVQLKDHIKQVEEVRKEVVAYINELNKKIEYEYSKLKDSFLDKKDFALQTRKNKLFHFLIRVYDNRDYDDLVKKDANNFFKEKYKSQKLFL